MEHEKTKNYLENIEKYNELLNPYLESYNININDQNIDIPDISIDDRLDSLTIDEIEKESYYITSNDENSLISEDEQNKKIKSAFFSVDYSKKQKNRIDIRNSLKEKSRKYLINSHNKWLNEKETFLMPEKRNYKVEIVEIFEVLMAIFVIFNFIWSICKVDFEKCKIFKNKLEIILFFNQNIMVAFYYVKEKFVKNTYTRIFSLIFNCIFSIITVSFQLYYHFNPIVCPEIAAN